MSREEGKESDACHDDRKRRIRDPVGPKRNLVGPQGGRKEEGGAAN